MKETYRLNRLLHSCHIMLVLLTLVHFADGQTQQGEWDNAETAARTYIGYPSSENARLLSNSIPGPQLPKYGSKRCYYRIAGYLFDNIDVLERQVSAGDRAAVRLGFKLYEFVDGIFAVELDRIMANLLRSYPRLFLEELISSPNIERIRTVGYPATSSKYEADEDRWDVYRYELEMRIKALETVTDSPLLGLRDTLIVMLKEELAKHFRNPPRAVLGKDEYRIQLKKAVVDINNVAVIAHLFCQRTIEIEQSMSGSPFGVASEKIMRSVNLEKDLESLMEKTAKIRIYLWNPPLDYSEAYSIIMSMKYDSHKLSLAAIKPSGYGSLGESEAEKMSLFRRNSNEIYDRYRVARAKLASIIPEISPEMERHAANLESIKEKIK
jgi:hypothetical protein